MPAARSSLMGWMIPAAVVAALACLPMRLVAGWIPSALNSRAVSGSIWHGEMQAASWSRPGADPVALGDLHLGLRVWPLLLGRAQMQFTRATDGAMPPLSGSVESGLNGRAVTNLTGTISRLGAGSALPIERMEFEGLSIRFAADRCVEAHGRLRIILAARIAGLEMRHGLQGEAQCSGAALLLPLTGESGMERMTVSVQGDGAFSARLGVRAADPALSAALSAAGMAPAADGFSTTLHGQL